MDLDKAFNIMVKYFDQSFNVCFSRKKFDALVDRRRKDNYKATRIQIEEQIIVLSPPFEDSNSGTRTTTITQPGRLSLGGKGNKHLILP